MAGTIQTGIDLLPATGAEVKLLDGTYNIATGLVLDSYQTLKGCGRNTILTATTADWDIITATGGDGTEKVGIILADFCIDGDAGGETNDIGIKWSYVDKSVIRNCWIQDNGENGLYIDDSDNNLFEGIYLSANGWYDLYLKDSDYCKIIGCDIAATSTDFGIELVDCDETKIIGNDIISTGGTGGLYLNGGNKLTIVDNYIIFDGDYGLDVLNVYDSTISHNIVDGGDSGTTCILVDTGCERISVSFNHTFRASQTGLEIGAVDHCTVSFNQTWRNGRYGLYLVGPSHGNFNNNYAFENSQATDNTYDDICLTSGNYNLIMANTCRAGSEANVPKYGINIGAGTGNKVINNDLYDDGFGTAPYNDDGTGTIYVEPGIDDTAVNGETGQPISSNWAYDHENAADPHPVYYLTSEVDDAIDADITTHAALDTGVHGAGAETLLNTGDVGTMAAETATDYLEIANLENPPTEDEATKAPTSEWAFDHDAATTGIHGVGANHIAEAPAASHLVRTFTKGWTSGVYLKGAGVDTNPTEVEFPYFGERRLVYFHDGSNHTGITAVVTGTGSVTQGVFNTLVLTGATNGSTARQYHTTTSWHLSPVSALTLPFFTVQPFHDTNVEIWYVITSEGTGYPTLNGSKVGFIFEDGKIYAHDGNGASNNKEEICSYSTSTVYVLRLIYSDSTVKFYVNGVLEATHPDGVYTEALPAHAGYRMMFAIKNTAAAAKFSALLQFAALKDLS